MAYSSNAGSPSPASSNSTRAQRDVELDGLANLDFFERTSRFIRGSTRHCVKSSTTVVDFRPLYAVTIHNLQRQLAQEISSLKEATTSETQLKRVEDLLSRYTKALRDFEFIHANRFETKFVKNIAASRIDDGPGSRLQRALIEEADLTVESDHKALYRDPDILGSFDHGLLQHSQSLGKTLGTAVAHDEAENKASEAVKNTWRRFLMAMLGAIAILIPALIIAVLDQVPTRTLVIVAISIFLFSCAVAVFASRAPPESVLAATAAYSAVLVVFIGNYTQQ